MTENLIPVDTKPLMGAVTDATGQAVRELVKALSAPASRAGIAACLGVTAVMARCRVPFPVTLFVAIVAGDAAEKAYAKFTGETDARETSIRGE